MLFEYFQTGVYAGAVISGVVVTVILFAGLLGLLGWSFYLVGGVVLGWIDKVFHESR